MCAPARHRCPARDTPRGYRRSGSASCCSSLCPFKEAPASSEANPKVCVVPSDNKHVTVTLSPGLCKKCHLGKSSVSISKSLREVSLLWFPDPSIVTRSSLDIKNCPAHFLPGRGRWRPPRARRGPAPPPVRGASADVRLVSVGPRLTRCLWLPSRCFTIPGPIFD